ncbi:outer membrane protein [Azorhizobium oxalatiphilum]|uniref:Outer membrane protein n=1 Tax=Azorhizobium oxalatiphilum TaxID=980631 RepID=A0A917CES3_9HYPH|nr:DsbA family protein [Azorhizobium oxalatiphilum]GGF83032.1 outer membrane protein [Azorhizobium oxalatiphilum]
MLSRSGLRAALAAVAALGLTATTVLPAAAFTDQEKAELGPLIRDYLVKNPEVLQEAIAVLEKRQSDAEAQARKQSLASIKSTVFDSPRGVVIGNPKGNVTLVEFFDYNCGYCKHALQDINALIKANPNLKVVLREFPVLGPGSVEAAQVAVTVRMVAPDKYRAFHDILLAGRGQADRARALAAAKEAGIDTALLQKQASSPELNATLDESMKIAQALGLNGTPSFVIGDDVIVGAVGQEKLQEAITANAKAAAN